MQMQMNDKTVLTTCYGKVGESNEVWTGTGWETHSSAKVGNPTSTNFGDINLFLKPQINSNLDWWHQHIFVPSTYFGKKQSVKET